MELGTDFRTRRRSGGAAEWLSALFAVASLCGCSSHEDASETNRIELGALVGQGDVGDARKEIGAALLAIRQINADGGVRIDGVDYELDLDPQDHGGTAKTTVAAMQRLSEDGITATIGPPWSSLALGTRPDHRDGASLMARKYDMLLVSASATAAAITDLDDDDLQWRTIPSDAKQGAIAAAEILGRGLTRAAILYRDEPWGQGMRDAFTEAFVAGGGSISAAVGYDVSGDVLGDPSAVDFSAELDAVFAEQPEVVLLYNFDEIFNITGRIAAGGYLAPYGDTPPLFFGSDANFTSDLLANGAPEVLRTFEGTSPTSDESSPYYRKFKDWLAQAELDASDNTAAPRYDAVYCLALAMQKAQSKRADDVKKQLRAVSRDDGGDLQVHAGEWAKAKAELLAGRDVDYDGVSGSIDFSERGDPTAGLYTIWKVEKNGNKFSMNTDRTVAYSE